MTSTHTVFPAGETNFGQAREVTPGHPGVGIELIVQCPGLALIWPGHFGAMTFGFFGLYPSTCQSTGFVSLAGKASLVSISDAVLFLRS